MIYSYGKCGKIDEVNRLMREMKALNISFSIVTYNSLLSCKPSVNYAEAVFNQVKISTPNSVSLSVFYDTFISIALAKVCRSRLHLVQAMISNLWPGSSSSGAKQHNWRIITRNNAYNDNGYVWWYMDMTAWYHKWGTSHYLPPAIMLQRYPHDSHLIGLMGTLLSMWT